MTRDALCIPHPCSSCLLLTDCGVVHIHLPLIGCAVCRLSVRGITRRLACHMLRCMRCEAQVRLGGRAISGQRRWKGR